MSVQVGFDARESVVINSFWRTPIVFHRRHDPGTACKPNTIRQGHDGYLGCGHAMPRLVAEKIARPCGLCFRTSEATS